MIVLHARPSPGFRETVDAIFGPGVVVHVDEAEPLDAVAPDITALLHVLTPVTSGFIASAPKLKLIQKLGVGVNTIALDAARGADVAERTRSGGCCRRNSHARRPRHPCRRRRGGA